MMAFFWLVLQAQIRKCSNLQFDEIYVSRRHYRLHRNVRIQLYTSVQCIHILIKCITTKFITLIHHSRTHRSNRNQSIVCAILIEIEFQCIRRRKGAFLKGGINSFWVSDLVIIRVIDNRKQATQLLLL